MYVIYTFPLLLTLMNGINATAYRVEYAEESCKTRKEVVYELGTEGILTSVVIRATRQTPYVTGMDCVIKITSTNMSYVLLSVKTLDFDRPETCQNYIEFMDNMENRTLCTQDTSEEITFSSNDSITFRYHTVTSGSSHIGFEVVATAYTNGTCGWNFDFLCANGNCISSKLICNGYNNCGDNSDESKDYSRCSLSKGAITGIVITSLLLISILCAGFCLFVKKKISSGKVPPTPKGIVTGSASGPLYQRLPGGTISTKYGASSVNC